MLLGRGGFASVFAAEYAYMHVAVKEEVAAPASGQPIPAAALAALRREAALHAALSHDNFVCVHSLAMLGEPSTKAGVVIPRTAIDVDALLQRVVGLAPGSAAGEAERSRLLPYA